MPLGTIRIDVQFVLEYGVGNANIEYDASAIANRIAYLIQPCVQDVFPLFDNEDGSSIFPERVCVLVDHSEAMLSGTHLKEITEATEDKVYL